MASEEETLGKAYDSRLMGRLLKYLKPYRVQVFVALIAIVLKAAADVMGPLLTMMAVDKYLAKGAGSVAVRHVTAKIHFPLIERVVALINPMPWLDRHLSANPMTGIGQIAGVFLMLLCFGFLLEFTETYLMQWTGQKVMFDLRSQLYRHLQQMHIAYFDKNPVGRLVTRVTTDVDAVNEMFTAGVVSIFEDIFVLVFIVGIMMYINWRLALICFAVLPLIFVATMMFRKSVRDSYRRIRTAIARINSYLQEHITGIVPLQLFNREEKAFEEFEKINAQHMGAFKDAIMAYALYYPIVELLSTIAVASIIWWGGHDVISGIVGVGALVAFIQYAQRFFRPIQDLSEKYNIIQSAMAASERIFKLLDTKTEIVAPADAKQPTGPGRIEFDHVWFAYRKVPPPDKQAAPDAAAVQGAHGEVRHEGDWDWVLRDVSFAIEPGETAAFVGHTGAGKTTIISLLLRFYDVQKGAVKIDCVNVRELDLQALRRRYGVVLQDPFLFSGTIEDNIKLGTEWIESEGVEQAARDVNVADYILSLPDGFKSEVRERGSTLSTGQKQLISFARALAHNPQILILDEATSSVDTETEYRVREALSRMVEGRTSVIIAHRLSTIQRADKIVVMHKGKVREMGTHQQLLAMRGIYYKLYQLQYKDQELGSAPIAGLEQGAASAVPAD